VKVCAVSMFPASPLVQCVSLDRILCLLERAVKCLICVLRWPHGDSSPTSGTVVTAYITWHDEIVKTALPSFVVAFGLLNGRNGECWNRAFDPPAPVWRIGLHEFTNSAAWVYPSDTYIYIERGLTFWLTIEMRRGKRGTFKSGPPYWQLYLFEVQAI